MKKLK
jgi:uncharacterized protein with ATP-grasp and redox domains